MHDRAIHTSGMYLCDVKAEPEKLKEAAKVETSSSAGPAIDTNTKDDQQKSEKPDDEAVRILILNAALKHVAAHGWTKMALTVGAEEEGYVSLVSGLFPNEGSDLIFHHVKSS